MDTLYEDAAERLRSCPAVLQVETGMNAKAALEMLALGAMVTALVSPLSDRADPVPDAAMIVSQREVHRFGVTLALVYPGGFSEFIAARRQIKERLRGWAPEGASMPVEYAGGRTLEYSIGKDGGRWLHLLEFTVPTQESYAHQS